MQLSQNATRFLQLAQQFIQPHNITTPTVTLRQVVRENSACSGGQEDTCQGYKAYTGQKLDENHPLTLGMAEISAPNYGLDWVWGSRSEWREELVRQAIQAMVRVVVKTVPHYLDDKEAATLWRENTQEFLAQSQAYVAGDLKRSSFSNWLNSNGSGVDSKLRVANLRSSVDLLGAAIDRRPENYLVFLERLLDCSIQEARHVAGAILMLLNKEPYEVPALPICSGARLKLGELLYELTFDGTTPVMTLIPYRLPEAGQKWLDDKGNEYLILAGAEQVVQLKTGALIPLSDGAIPETVRGVSFTYKA